MPPGQFNELNDKLDAIKGSQDRLVIAVCGDDYDLSKPGLIRGQARLDIEVYGQDGKGGLKSAMDNYRTNQNKLIGASLFIGVVGTVLGIGAAIFEAIGSWVKK